jgi:proteasome lid subunit RPN8/RPN11
VVNGENGDADILPSSAEWAEVKREPSSRIVAGAGGGAAEASISAVLLQEVIDAARAAVPNEAAGLLVSHRYFADGGAALRYVALRNAAESPYRYLIDPDEQLTTWTQIEDGGEVVWAIVHSHVASPAEPSQTDVGLAFFPDSLYVICSLMDDERPTVRAWSIVDAAMSEVALLVTE